MAKNSKREKIKLVSTESSYFYTTMKNKSNTPDKLQCNKYDPTLRRVVVFKEAKIK